MAPSQPGSPAWTSCLPLGDQPPIASQKKYLLGCLFHNSFDRFFPLCNFLLDVEEKKFATCVAQLPVLGRTASDCLEHHWERPQMTTLLMDGSGPNGQEPLILSLQCWHTIHLPLSSMAYPPWRHVVPQWRTFVNKAQWNCRMLKSVCQGCRRFLTITDPRWDQPISDIFI